MRLLSLIERACRDARIACRVIVGPLASRHGLLVALSALTLGAAGCRPAPPPPPAAPSLVPSSGPVLPAVPPTPRGEIDGRRFVARSTVLWLDATATWLSFEDEVPVTGGRYDPRATRAPANGFQIFLDPARLRPGRYEARDGAVPPDSPIHHAVVQTVNRQTRQVHVADSDWSVVLVINRVIERKSKSGDIALSIQGHVELDFNKPASHLEGAFAAHDLLTDDEVAPGAPPLSAPAVSPSGAPSAAPAATSPGRTD